MDNNNLTNPSTNPAGETNPNNTNNSNNVNDSGTAMSYSQSDIDRMIQKAVESYAKKAEKDKQKAITEAQRLATLSESERTAEYIRQLESENESGKQRLAVMENTSVCLTECAKRGIPAELNEFIVDSDSDVMFERLGKFERILKKMVNDEITKRVGSTKPQASNSSPEDMTAESFRKLSLSAQNEIYRKNPEIYKKLTERN